MIFFIVRNKVTTGPAEQFSKCGRRATSFEVGGGGTFIMVYLVPTHYFSIQFQLINNFLNSLTNEKGVSNKKGVTMHSSIIIFACFIRFQSFSFLSLRLFRTFFLTIVEGSHFFNLRAAEKDLFLLRWLQDLPAEPCKSGQIYSSCSAEVIPETSSCCLPCRRIQFVFKKS